MMVGCVSRTCLSLHTGDDAEDDVGVGVEDAAEDDGGATDDAHSNSPH